VAAALGSACRDAGFFYVTGYGFAAGLPAQVFQAAHAFFAPPIEEKQRLSIKHSPHNRGHVEMQGERLQHAGRSAGRSPRLCASRGESEMRTSEPKPPVGCALRVCRSFHPHYICLLPDRRATSRSVGVP
jgi:isopenicillin N synthase-like dioxygenase